MKYRIPKRDLDAILEACDRIRGLSKTIPGHIWLTALAIELGRVEWAFASVCPDDETLPSDAHVIVEDED